MFSKFLGLALIFAGWLPVTAQLGLPQAREGSVHPFNEYVLSDWMLKNKNQYEDIEGSPFLTDNWVKGTIHTIHDQRFQEVQLKLNVYQGQLMHLNKFTNDSSMINHELLLGFSMTVGDSILVFEKFDVPKSNKPAPLADFFVVLVNDKYSLLAKPRMSLQRASDNSLVNSTGKLKDRFVSRNEYYVLYPDKSLTRLKNSRKSLKLIFGEHFEACRSYLVQHDVSWTEPGALQSLLIYYNEIAQ